jgi:hypothetical protein
MHETSDEEWGMNQAHTFLASWTKVEYFWMPCWIVSASVTLSSVMRTMFGMLAVLVDLVLGVFSCVAALIV